MKFLELTEEEFNRFSEHHIYSSFYQTVEWGKLKKSNGWDSHFVGVKENDKIIAASLLLSKNAPLKSKMFYAPRGFLIDYNNFELVSFFTKNVKIYVKNNKGIFLKIDPYIIYQERDINGDIVENGENNIAAFNNLIKLGYKHNGFRDSGNLQPQYTFTLNIKDKSIEELYKDMRLSTKQAIKKNEESGIICREIDLSELKKFTDVMQETSVRRGFIDRPYEYYEKMIKIFKNNIKILISEINLKDYVSKLTAKLDDAKNDLATVQNKLKGENPNHKRINNEINEINKLINSTSKRIEKANSLIKEKGDILVLGALMFMFHNKEILSLFGGAYGECMDFTPAYSLNYHMIKYGTENGYEKYNFYGISDFKNEKSEMYGLYNFKRGFCGQVEEYFGEFDLIINKTKYVSYDLSFKAYKFLKNVKNKTS